MADYSNARPEDVWLKIRSGEITGQTSGMCNGYAQANLVIMPEKYAGDFEQFARHNPKPCPLLEVMHGSRYVQDMGKGADILTDIPKYRIFENGVLVKEVTDATPYWQDDMAVFLIGWGGIIDAMFVDASSIIEAARERGITTISIGDGGNEIGMGALAETIEKYVPHGKAICAREVADIALISGVSNWWGWGVSALLSRMYGINQFPSDDMERGMLHEMVLAGSVDGCTKKPEETVDKLPMEVHLGVLSNVRSAMQEK